MSKMKVSTLKMESESQNKSVEALIDIIRKRINKSPRQNQVLAIRISMVLEKDAISSIDLWKARCRKWLRDKFEVAGDNLTNILCNFECFDLDGNFHIIAIIIPIDEMGNLNASRFLRKNFSQNELQISFREYTKNIGFSGNHR